MQIIITEEEYKQLKEDARLGLDAPNKEDLQKFCTVVADKMPVRVDWLGVPAPWGCILSKSYEWYCDGCPSRLLCPYKYKSWSR